MAGNRSYSEVIPSSFRDPSGFLFSRNKILYRQVNSYYQEEFQALTASGLYESLINKGYLIPHAEVREKPLIPACSFKVIKPELIPFISYPYEWSFSQIKDAALLTLEIQKESLNHNMTLKDASAYNIQFYKGKPIFIDTLSFEKYKEGSPWVAYRQFCQHFLAPLALMCKKDIRLSQLMRIYIDGIPLDLASKLLPASSKFSLSLLTHIHLHAKSQKRYEGEAVNKRNVKVTKTGLLGILENLGSIIKNFKWQPEGTEWGDYYDFTNYSESASNNKAEFISSILHAVKPSSVWDLGANTGVYSRIASNMGINTVAFDIDPAAVEKNYRDCAAKKETAILPLVLDLTNPSPGIGWKNTERLPFQKRGPADMVMALALVHHLAIGNNIPLPEIALYFSSLCEHLIIEFIPKNDSQVQRLLASREDIFTGYTQTGFEDAFKNYFKIINRAQVKDSDRTIYHMRIK